MAACSTAVASAQVEAHEAALGLVRDRVAVQLQDHRVADGVGGGDGGGGIGRDPLVGHGDPVRGDQGLRFGFRQGRHGREGIAGASAGRRVGDAERRRPRSDVTGDECRSSSG